MVAAMILMLLAAASPSQSLSAPTAHNLTGVTSAMTSSSTVIHIIATLGTTTLSSSLPTPFPEFSTYHPFLRDNDTSPSFIPMPTPTLATNYSVLLNPTACIYSSITVTRTVSYAFSTSSFASAVTKAPTVYVCATNKTTAPNSFTEPHTISAARAWVSTVFDFIEIFHRGLNTMLALYNIRMTARILVLRNRHAAQPGERVWYELRV